MSPGRSNKPLFEVLSQHPPRGINPPGGAGAPAARPEASEARPAETEPGTEAVQTELKPRVVPVPVSVPVPVPGRRPVTGRPEDATRVKPSEAGAEDRAAEELDEVADAPPRPVVTIPLSTVYSAVALAGALILIAWIGGHTMGANSKEAEFRQGAGPRDLLTEPTEGVGDAFDPVVRDPSGGAGLIQDPSRGAAGGFQAGADPVTNPVPPAVSPGIQPSANGTILSAAGMLEVDPREAGLNYLELGTFTREMTQDAIDYLAASGVPSIGVPQPGGRYRLVSVGLGIPGGQWTAMASQRSQHQRTVGDIGTRWVQERQGGSDFKQTQWTKYQP